MSDFDAIDSLLASLTPEADLPDAETRRTLREQAGLSKAQVARTLGVSPSTVTGWETGRDPAGQTRTTYADLLGHFLDGSGEPVEVDADRMLADMPAFRRNVDTTLAEVRKLPDGAFESSWQSSAPDPPQR
ncbi:helix-turn-helix domain-containing protein [Streptomyces sp. NBC_01525]|uniref:helix-turn-helix domain-containing protein n=1 Tax=Streptomyces sp. NBC_01525 TaxID=2903893 RepID=UPI00386BF47C